MKKRILSIVLSIVMLVSLLPTTALALETPSHTDHCVCGGSVTAGDHTHDAAASTWKAWNGEDASAFTGGIQLNAGNYYLTGNLTLSETIRISGTVNLCLNGHSITTSETNAINVSSGTTLNICDCSEEGLGSISTTGDGSEGDVIYNYYGTVNVYGGSISATGSRGDGIYNIGNGTKGVVNIYGGNISTDTSNLYYGIRNKGGIVNVYDGSISALGDSPYGIYSTHSATVSGGTVSGSTSGIHNANADAILIVSGSASVIGDSYGISSYCGNLQLSGNPGITGGSADIRLDGGTNNAPTIGIDGVLANTEKYTVMTYQTPTTENPVVFTSAVDEGNADKFESADSAYQVIYEGGVLKLAVSSATPAHAHDMSVSCGGSGVTFEAWDGTGTPTGNVYLTGDVTLAETLIISSGTVNLCLNGYSITRSDWYPTIRIEDGATLNLCDCNGSGKNNGSVTNNFDVCVVNDGALTVYGGTVEGPTWGITNRGTLTVYGGSVASTGERGIYNAEGTVYIYGGTVSGNSYGIYNEGGTANVTGGTVTATGSNFYGIYNRSNGTVTVSGGTVTATGSNSWGIYNHSDGTTDVDTTTNVSGTANVSGSFLGIYNSGTLTVSGGTVTATGSNGFGIYNFYHGAGSLELSGAPTITGATAGVYLDGGSITLGGELTYVEEKAISVGMETPGTFTSGWNSNMSGKTPGNYFTSAMDGYTVQPDGSGELKLAEPPAHSHDMSVECGGSGVTFEPWDGTTTFPGGNVYLTKDVTLADTLTISSGTVNMCLNGHSITNSSAAIEVKSGATLNICDCSEGKTGTISATASGSRGIENYGILTVYGGTVSGNTYGICNNYGGNVAVSGGTVSGGTGIENYGTLTVSGGSVTGTYDYGGYGISSYGTFKLSGAPTITGGSNSADVLIHAYQKVITIDGTLTYSTPISVEPYNGYSAFTNGWNDKMPTADHKDYFIPASGKYVFVESSDELKPAYTVTYDANGAASGSVPVDSSSPYFYSNVVTVLDNTGGLAEEGYEFSGWNTKADGTGTHYAPDSTFTIYSNTTLYAVWKVPHIHEYTYAVNTENAAQVIESCTCGHKETATLELDTTVSTVYTGSAIKALKVTYSSGWVGDQNAAISYSNNTNAGTASGSVTIGGLTVTKSFTITKKSAEAPAAPTAQNSITYGAELSEVGLTAGWTWADGNTIPTVNNSGYTAYYTPADVTNLDWTAVDGWNASAGRVERTVAVTVNKSAPTYTAPTGLTATYGDTLEDIKISDWGSGWSWKEPTTSVGDVGTKTFVAVFTPTDTNNYKSIEVDITVTVNHAEPGYNPPTAKQDLVYSGIEKELVNKGTATGGSMQYALGADGTTAPASGWSTYVPVGRDAGTYYIWYKVVGDDNHNDVAPACVAVTIAKKQIAKPAADNSTFTYNGSYQTYAMNEDPAFIIKNNVQKNAGSYTVTVKLQDTANYEWTDGTTAVLEYTFKIEQKEIGISWSNTALTYNGAAQRPTATATGVVTGEQIALLLSAPETNAGSYTATVHSIDGATAQNYKLPTNKSTSFTIEQQALTILWGNGTFTYDGAEKFPAFNVEGIWNADDVQVTKEGAQTNAGEYTAQIIGLAGSDAGNYKLTGTLTKDFVINKADQAAPVVNKADETISGKNDGKITDVTANMEYRAEGEDRYTAITGEAVDNLADGKYYVRVKGDSNHNPSADTAVVIGAGRMLTVTVPQNQVGYTMTVDKSTATYGEAVKVTFALNDGYSAADGFAVKLNGSAITLSNGEYTVANTTEDLAFTVEGVADITAPLAQIDIKNNKWSSFWNGVTFGLFFNETQDVTVTAADTGSGVNTIQYYLASGELELDEVKQIPVWQDYNGTFQIDPDNAYVVYVKVTDNAGNVSYLNSDGVVLDQTVPVLVGIENGEDYYGDKIFKALDDYLATLKVDGVDVTDEMNADNEYTIVADNAEHIVTATDKAGNATEYKITVFKNYTVTYKVDGNTVSTQTVGHGKDAVAPTIPAKDGYTQTAPAWDKDGTNITADTEINAVYTINKYTVTYKADGNVVGTVEVEHGKDATAPAIPEKEGYTKTAPVWDKDGKNITADTEINAVYTINKYAVTYKADGNVVGTVEVEHGKDATAPAIPEKEGYTKTAPIWDKDGKNITADTEINAVYTINEYTITFMYEDGVYKTLTVKHGEKVEMPEVPAKDGYTVTWDTTIEVATSDATVNAVYTKNAVSDNPQTGDNSNLTLWWILLLVSAAGITLATIEQKKRKAMK